MSERSKIMKSSFVFKRKEKKYIINSSQYRTFLIMAKKYIEKDKYEKYTICNIYYDTQDYDLIRKSIEKPSYKEKLRLRSYGIPSKSDKVYIELKKKYNGIVFKRRISATLEESENYLNNNIPIKNSCQIFNEIDYFKNLYHIVPKKYIAYDRTAFSGLDDPSLRITFDENIRSRDYDLTLDAGDYGEILTEKGIYIMEIKASSVYPLWLCHILSELKIYPSSYSKYGNVYKKELLTKRSS